jgi:hypothetical protein
MRMSFGCAIDHEPAHPFRERSVRIELENGRCPVCIGEPLEGEPYGGLEWGTCACCGASWRLEDDGFAVRTGELIEEWN